MKKVAVYPGSFDPITKGHLDLIKRSIKIFDEVIVLVSEAIEKKYLFSIEERMQLVRLSLGEAGVDLKNIHIQSTLTLTMEFLKKNKIDVVIRGLRSIIDFENERAISQINHQLYSEVESVFLISKPEFQHVSSRAIKEISKFDGELSAFVTKSVEAALKNKKTK